MNQVLPTCWSCDAPADGRVVDVESVIQARIESEGGPFHWYPCPACGAHNGVLAAPGVGWMLHPLEGREGPTAVDWIGSRSERELRRKAQDWWGREGAQVERFRRAAVAHRKGAGPRPSPRPQPSPQPSPQPAPAKKRAQRAPPPPRPPPPPPEPPPEPAPPKRAQGEPRGPHEILGVPVDANLTAIRQAYRAAVKKCHPDRFAHLDEEFQELANRKMKQLRLAYDTLISRSEG